LGIASPKRLIPPRGRWRIIANVFDTAFENLGQHFIDELSSGGEFTGGEMAMRQPERRGGVIGPGFANSRVFLTGLVPTPRFAQCFGATKPHSVPRWCEPEPCRVRAFGLIQADSSFPGESTHKPGFGIERVVAFPGIEQLMGFGQSQGAKIAADIGRADLVPVRFASAEQLGQVRLGAPHVARLGGAQQLFAVRRRSFGAALSRRCNRGGRLIQPSPAPIDTGRE
jgi:hypothetical protein